MSSARERFFSGHALLIPGGDRFCLQRERDEPGQRFGAQADMGNGLFVLCNMSSKQLGGSHPPDTKGQLSALPGLRSSSVSRRQWHISTGPLALSGIRTDNWFQACFRREDRRLANSSDCSELGSRSGIRETAVALPNARRKYEATSLHLAFPQQAASASPTFRSVKKHWCVCILPLSTCFLGRSPYLKVREKNICSISQPLSFKSSVFTIILNINKTSNTGINDRGSPVF